MIRARPRESSEQAEPDRVEAEEQCQSHRSAFDPENPQGDIMLKPRATAEAPGRRKDRQEASHGHRRSLCFLPGLGIFALVAICTSPAIGQIPGLGSGMGLPEMDPTELERRMEKAREECNAQKEDAVAIEKAMCKAFEAAEELSQGRREEGFALFEEAIADLEATGDRLGRALLHVQLAGAAQLVGDGERAIANYEAGLALLDAARSDGAPIPAESLRYFGRVAGLPEAQVEQIVAMGPAVQPMLIDQLDVQTRLLLTEYLLAEARLEQAEPHLEAAVEKSARLLGLFDAPVLELFGRLREQQGRPAAARRFYERAMRSARETGNEEMRTQLRERIETLDRSEDPEQAPSPDTEPETDPGTVPEAAPESEGGGPRP